MFRRSHLLQRFVRMSFTQIIFIWVALLLVFAVSYAALSYLPQQGPAALEGKALIWRLLNALYFSVITATFTGYGDIVPMGYSKVFASVQSIISLFVFTILVSKIVSQRQEMALEQIHRLTFEEFLHNLREGFFIIRKDCDRLLARLRDGAVVTEKDWMDTEAAFRQGQTHLDEIPGFFANEAGLYAIDPKREELLFESIERTMQRFQLVIEALEERGSLSNAPASWKKQMDGFFRDALIAVQTWSERSPRVHMRERLAELLPWITRIRNTLQA